MKINVWDTISVLFFIAILVIVLLFSISFLPNIEYHTNYYRVWSLGAITSVFLFGIINNIGNITKINRSITGDALKGLFSRFAGIVVLYSLFSLVAAVYIGYQVICFSNPTEFCKWLENHHAQQYIQVLLVSNFTLYDRYFLQPAYESTIKVERNNITITELNRELALIHRTIRYVDYPCVISFLFLIFYYVVGGPLFDEYFQNFIGGAEAFALIAFNIIYIYIIFEQAEVVLDSSLIETPIQK
jgi:hypothetical protein